MSDFDQWLRLTSGFIFIMQHAIQVVIRPPEAVRDLPSFKHEVSIRLTTDQFGTMASELLALGGIPTPALGLSDTRRSLRAIL